MVSRVRVSDYVCIVHPQLVASGNVVTLWCIHHNLLQLWLAGCKLVITIVITTVCTTFVLNLFLKYLDKWPIKKPQINLLLIVFVAVLTIPTVLCSVGVLYYFMTAVDDACL